jgi:RNA polymerase sigma-70 factor (ECF subfamily)
MSVLDNFKYPKKFFAIRNLEETNLSNDQSAVGKVVKRETTNAPIPDEQLVIASQQGDIEAFETLVLRYQRQIFSLIYQMTRNVEVVEDIGQDVFIAAFKAIKDFKAKSSFFTWLYRIAINHCKNYLTASTRAQDIEQRYQREQNPEEFLENQERDPQSMLLAKEFVEQMEDAIMSLPEEQRIVLRLCEFEGLSYQEIADVLECPIGTVRSRLSRARTTLQETLSDFLR